MEKVVSDILVHDGTAWVSVKGGNVKMFDGTGFSGMGTNDNMIFDGGDWCYALGATFTLSTHFVSFVRVEPFKTVTYSTNPPGTVSVASKPSWLNVVVLAGYVSLSLQSAPSEPLVGDVDLSCDNGAGNQGINVSVTV